MHLPSRLSTCFVFTSIVAAIVTWHHGSVAAQSGYSDRSSGYGLPWENSRIRVNRVSVEPGATLPSSGDRVLVYLSADANGRMPAEAVWQPAGGAGQNSGRARLEAVAIDFKDAPAVRLEGTPPEALTPSASGYSSYDSTMQVTVLVDNPRVLVAKHRYPPNTFNGQLHFHPQDIILLYLRGGYAPAADGLWGLYRVRRGDVDIVPANTLHTVSNPGSDPLELLVVVPK
jgi:quercetin dioxygenase-like cupin family protein